MAKEQDPSDLKKPKIYRNYLIYSGLAIQLAVIIGLCAWLGHTLDTYIGLTFPVFLLLLSMGAFAGAMVLMYRSL